MKKTFTVTGMHCKSCEMLLEDALEEFNGVEVVQGSVSCDLETPEQEQEVVAIIKKEGFDVQ